MTSPNCKVRATLVAAAALVLLTVLLTWSAGAQATVNVFACEPDWASLAQEIGGGYVTVYSATTARQDPHQVQARPSLIARLRNADLMVCNGAELEIGWLPVLLIQSANANIQPGTPGYLMVAEHVTLLETPARYDRALGDVHPFGNPHINTGPQNIQTAADLLVERLAIIDPDHSQQYQSRYRDFSTRWQAAMKRWQVQAAPLKGVPVLEHHKAWIYLDEWLGLQEAGFLEPKPGVPPSAAHLNALLAQLKFKPAKMVLRSAYDSAQASEFISATIGIPQIVLPYTVGGTPAATDLFGVFDDTIARLLEGLNGKSDTRITER